LLTESINKAVRKSSTFLDTTHTVVFL